MNNSLSYFVFDSIPSTVPLPLCIHRHHLGIENIYTSFSLLHPIFFIEQFSCHCLAAADKSATAEPFNTNDTKMNSFDRAR